MAVRQEWVSKHLLILHYEGTVVPNDAVQSLLGLAADPRFDDLLYLIGDCSNVGPSPADEQDVNKLAAAARAIAKSNPRIRNAVIVGPSEDSQAIAAFYGFLAQDAPWKVELFRTRAEAEQWLGLTARQ